VRPCWSRFCRDCPRPLANPAATADLIAFLQALPEARKRRGVRYPQWLQLLMAILGILSGCCSVRDLERFAKRHHQAFGAALGLELPKAPCDSPFLYLFERIELEQLFRLLREWMLGQIAYQNKDFDQLICVASSFREAVDKSLCGSAAQADGADGAKLFATQDTLYARELGVAIAQTSFDTGESHERAALKTLLRTMDMESVLIQADALHTSPSFFNSPPSRAPTCS
jgi:hypothetical protein